MAGSNILLGHRPVSAYDNPSFAELTVLYNAMGARITDVGFDSLPDIYEQPSSQCSNALLIRSICYDLELDELSMWHTRTETLQDGRVQKFSILRGESRLLYAEVLELWRVSDEFRAFFTRLLSDSPFPAYRWETPSVTAATVGRDFEFVLLRSDGLARAVEPAAFASHFTDDDVVVFANLSGDATMVVPCPIAADVGYGHLAAFLRSAPETQIHSLWKTVGRVMQDRLGDRPIDQPIWLSTAGMGVSWLHVRLDSRPKYYGYTPFK